MSHFGWDVVDGVGAFVVVSEALQLADAGATPLEHGFFGSDASDATSREVVQRLLRQQVRKAREYVRVQ